MNDLCAASHQQLFSRTSNSEKYNKWWKLRNLGKITNVKSDHSLFLSRINQVMLKCIKSGRPLMHIMKIWSLIGPHYIEVITWNLFGKKKLRVNDFEIFVFFLFFIFAGRL